MVNISNAIIVQYDTFYDGQIQQDGSECLLMLKEAINKGSVLYCACNHNNSTGVLYLIF